MLRQACFVTLLLAAAYADYPMPKVAESSSRKVLASYNGSTLYALDSPGYNQSFLLIDLHGSRYEQGFAYGKLLADRAHADFSMLFESQLPNKVERSLLQVFLDIEYKFFEPHIPSEFMEEINGVLAGIETTDTKEAVKDIKRGLVLSSFPGDVVGDIKWLVINEIKNREELDESRLDIAELTIAWDKLMADRPRIINRLCSQLAVWGDRADNGSLYQTRNLDWAADTGLADNKLITVWHPPGKFAHAAAGFAGLYGALLGMSAEGITVGESGDDNTRETPHGMPWILRLRLIMENAKSLNDAKQLWESSNNTMGVNHVIGSAKEPAAMALETCAGYTAYFNDDDEREKQSTVNGTRVGFPMKNAVWRTNHAYDPTWLKTEMHARSAHGDSQVRYALFHEALSNYEAAAVKVGIREAINMTSLVADKTGSDRESFMHCVDGSGQTIISGAMDPANLKWYLAFEEGRGEHRISGGCSTYLGIDMTQYFKQTE